MALGALDPFVLVTSAEASAAAGQQPFHHFTEAFACPASVTFTRTRDRLARGTTSTQRGM
jgi:hypothetical protein